MPGATPIKAFPFPLLTEVVTHQSTQDLAEDIATELDLQDVAQNVIMNRPQGATRRAASQSIADGVDTVITMDTERWDTGGLVDIGTDPTRLTVPPGVEGLWYVMAYVSVMSSASWTKGQITVRRAGVTGVLRRTYSAAPLFMQITGMVYVPAGGSYLELMVLHNGGGATNVSGAEMRAFRGSLSA